MYVEHIEKRIPLVVFPTPYQPWQLLDNLSKRLLSLPFVQPRLLLSLQLQTLQLRLSTKKIEFQYSYTWEGIFSTRTNYRKMKQNNI